VREPTPSQTVGPYFALGLTPTPQHQLVPPGTPGAFRLVGRVTDGSGDPVNDALLELWQPGDPTLWGRCRTDADGWYEFLTVKPAARDGEAPYADVLVFARGLLRHLATRAYFPDEQQANAADPVLSSLDPEERATLIAQAEEGALRFDVRLQGDAQTVFFAV
jgi:protocatechuate 3,4-dioxygenase, alpha subunit